MNEILSAGQLKKILAFVDLRVPGPSKEVWLTGSRAKGTARPDSDWDVVAFTPDAPAGPRDLFECSFIQEIAPGLQIELVVAHPRHRDDLRSYMTDLRNFGIRLR